MLLEDVRKYVEDNIGTFHQSRIGSLDKLKLTDVLKRKNPYLFKAKNIHKADEIVTQIVDAFISSAEETKFGNWLEGLAIFINGKVYNGWKSGINGIDLEFDNDGKRFIVAIKSGPKWANKGQITEMRSNFNSARKALRSSNSKIDVVAVNGCCYGRESKADKGDYFKYCGQNFWEFISGDVELYKEIISPLGYMAKEKNDIFKKSYDAMLNKFTGEFITTFCNKEGIIDWEKLIVFNSASKITRPPGKRKTKSLE